VIFSPAVSCSGQLFERGTKYWGTSTYPDAELDFLSLHFHFAHAEVYTNGGAALILGREAGISESGEERALPDAAVADEQQLEVGWRFRNDRSHEGVVQGRWVVAKQRGSHLIRYSQIRMPVCSGSQSASCQNLVTSFSTCIPKSVYTTASY